MIEFCMAMREYWRSGVYYIGLPPSGNYPTLPWWGSDIHDPCLHLHAWPMLLKRWFDSTCSTKPVRASEWAGLSLAPLILSHLRLSLTCAYHVSLAPPFLSHLRLLDWCGFTHVHTCNVTRVQSATDWTASVHTLHVSTPVM